jgi:hypothetical protein
MDFGNFNQKLISHLINEKKYSLKKDLSLGLVQNLEFGAPEGTSSKIAEKNIEDFLNMNKETVTFNVKNGTYRIVIKGFEGTKVIGITAFSTPLFACCLMTIADI